MTEREKRNKKDESAEVEETQGAGKSGRLMKLVLGILVLIILAGGGTGGWMFYQNRAEGLKQAEAQGPQIGSLWSMGTLIVNLLDSDGERYLKISIELELSAPEILTELDLLKPKILDGILDLLSSKYYRDIVGFEGKQHLRDEIALRINNYLSKGTISQVYFTDFVIQ